MITIDGCQYDMPTETSYKIRNIILSSFLVSFLVKPKSYQREGQPRNFLSITCCAIKGKEIM